MTTGKLAVLVLAAAVALGAGMAAIFDAAVRNEVEAIDLDEKDDAALRRDGAGDDLEVVEDDDVGPRDGDGTRGNDGTRRGDNTGDGDATDDTDGTGRDENSTTAGAGDTDGGGTGTTN